MVAGDGTCARGHHHAHVGGSVTHRGERRVLRVMVLAAVTMVAELAAGAWTGSLALLADGWHMATHVGALGLAYVAYWLARRWERAGRFAFGPGKVTTLAGFASALLLGVAAVMMLVEAIERLASPQGIRFAEALPVAVLGLVVNIVSVWLLAPAHADDHHDHNLRAAYLHVLADLLTSLLAIAALVFGYFTRGVRLDAVAAVVGALVILWWAAGLLRTSTAELIDLRLPAENFAASLRERIEADGVTSMKDLIVWPLGAGKRACHLGLVSARPLPLEHYRRVVVEIAAVDYVAIEILAPHAHDHPAAARSA
jgi:cation diffusion facilitator family transporter